MNEWVMIGLGLLLTVGTGLFVASEFALVNLDRHELESRRDGGEKRLSPVIGALTITSTHLSSAQLGITLTTLLTGSTLEPAISSLLRTPLSELGLDEPAVTAALLLAPPLVLISRVFGLVIAALNWIANGLVRLCGVKPKDEATSTYTLEEVAGIVEQSRREGTLSDTAGTLAGAFEFTDKLVADEEVPMDEMVLLAHRVTPRQVHQAVVEHGYSRYVIKDEAGEPSGYLPVKDVMDLEAAFDSPVPAKRIRRLIAVTRNSDLEDGMRRMRQHGTHVARTVDPDDPDDSTTGLLFLEDVLEVLVGEVNDATARH